MINKLKDRLYIFFILLKDILNKQTKDTTEMLIIYKKTLSGDSTKNEVKKANKQFRMLIKSTGIGILMILPFAPITLFLLYKIGKFVGVDILPSDFFPDK